MINLVGGLPVHPLIVHLVVIALPLSVALVAMMAFWRPARNRWVYGISFALALSGTISAWLAKWSGEQLTQLVGYPGEHAELGEMTAYLATAYTVLLLGWAVAVVLRQSALAMNILTYVTLAVGGVLLGYVVLAGHSGAATTWEDRLVVPAAPSVVDSTVDTSTPDTQPDASSDSTPDTTNTDTEDAAGNGVVLSEELLAQYFGSRDYCWTIVDGTVYNLTDFVDDHRGGPGNILEICGKDGSALFATQHAGERSPAATLTKYVVGVVGAEVDPAQFDVPAELLQSVNG